MQPSDRTEDGSTKDGSHVETTLAPPHREVAAQTHNAGRVYGKGNAQVRAIDGVTVSFAKGQFTAIMGPSGSGKSTLLHCMAGLDNLTSGSVSIGDTNVTALSEAKRTELRRDRVGFIFQSYNLVPSLTARENILLHCTFAKTKPDQAWFDEIVSTMGLADRLSHTPTELSGGQQQRVAAARALVHRPEIVFADEPTGALDSRSGRRLLTLLAHVAHDKNQTIVMVTHDPVAASFADRVIFLADGKVVQEITKPTVERILQIVQELDEKQENKNAEHLDEWGDPLAVTE